MLAYDTWLYGGRESVVLAGGNTLADACDAIKGKDGVHVEFACAKLEVVAARFVVVNECGTVTRGFTSEFPSVVVWAANGGIFNGSLGGNLGRGRGEL